MSASLTTLTDTQTTISIEGATQGWLATPKLSPLWIEHNKDGHEGQPFNMAATSDGSNEVKQDDENNMNRTITQKHTWIHTYNNY